MRRIIANRKNLRIISEQSFINMPLEKHLYSQDFFRDPNNPKSECTLQASGKGFDPIAFVSESELSQVEGIVKGTIGLPEELRMKANTGELPYDGVFDIFDMPFLLIRVSKATLISVQFEEAILFLKKYSKDVKKLGSYPNVETTLIRFSANDCDPSGEGDPPDEFLRLYGELGIRGLIIG